MVRHINPHPRGEIQRPLRNLPDQGVVVDPAHLIDLFRVRRHIKLRRSLGHEKVNQLMLGQAIADIGAVLDLPARG